MSDALPPRRPPHRGIYLLPNLFTTGAMFAGFYAIVASIGGHYRDAVIAVFVAAILDGLDGRVARMTHTQTEFGVQYDSLSDLVSFGLAPSLVLYNWSLKYLALHGEAWGKAGWAAAFLYAACAALRLARFNTQVGVADKRYFQGLASPAAAGLCMSYVWAMEEFDIPGGDVDILSLIVAAVAGLLMVSRFRYFSFKSWPERVPYTWLVLMLLALVALAVATGSVMFSIALVYVASGPVITLWGRATHRRRPRRASEKT